MLWACQLLGLSRPSAGPATDPPVGVPEALAGHSAAPEKGCFASMDIREDRFEGCPLELDIPSLRMSGPKCPPP